MAHLAKFIYSDSADRYNWEYGISQADNLRGKNSKDVLEMLNAVLNVGPAYDKGGLVGFPTNVLLIDLMQN